ncbi:hypothetical protein [Algibacter sp. Ld11]|uniref:hypothetical protein n=1 Tax=Algibacter sp. Ld11 TaxID=649150 RepID=UPI0038670086
MKIKLIIILLIGITSLGFSQNTDNFDRDKLKNYYLINKFNDTTQVHSETMRSEEIHCGFDLYDTKGRFTNKRVDPKDFKYLLFKNSEGRSIKLKSIPVKKIIKDCIKKNVFMEVLIENSDQDLKNGKVDFYSHKYTYMNSYEFGDSNFGEQGYSRDYAEDYYFKDMNGIHQINFNYQFKRFPKLLGKELYKKMKKSNKGEKQFLLDYFSEYNWKR